MVECLYTYISITKSSESTLENICEVMNLYLASENLRLLL